MRATVVAALKILGLIIAFAFAVGIVGYYRLIYHQPFSSAALAVIALVGAIWLFRSGRGVVRRTAAWLSVIYAALALAALFSQLNNSSTERRLARAEEEQRQQRENTERLVREAAEKEEQKKRELAELQDLRKTNPDEYLVRLKMIDLPKWVDEAKVLRPKVYAAYQEEVRKQNERAEYAREREAPKDFLTLEHSWRAAGFGNVMVADFTIKSTLLFAVKDITIRCTGYGASGTTISELAQTVYDIVPAKSTKRLNGVNMGFMSSQVSTAACQIVSVVPM
jgi:hypothetical protein